MVLAIYRKDGKIERIHSLESKDWSNDVAAYNTKHADEGKTAEVADFDDNSIEVFLYKEQALKKQHFREQLSEIASSVNSLDRDLSWLQDELDRMEE